MISLAVIITETMPSLSLVRLVSTSFRMNSSQLVFTLPCLSSTEQAYIRGQLDTIKVR